LVNASIQAMLAGFSGLLVSYYFNTPSGPTIIGCAGALYGISLLIAPGGWIPGLLPRKHRVA
jgi:zinc/manganese transport system permease protein